jgi:hypothetical protein
VARKSRGGQSTDGREIGTVAVMQRPIVTASLALLSAALIAPLAACNGPHPFVREGDSTSVDVIYAGDVAEALPVATKHCAQYERVPQYVDAVLGVASFKCVRR